jgi:hypothetical protein
MITANRIVNGINRARGVIAAKGLTAEKLASMAASLDMALGEYCKFQEEKSLASQDGRLSMDEAMTVYGYLGDTPDHFNRQDIAVKWVLSEVFASLLSKRIASRGVAVAA